MPPIQAIIDRFAPITLDEMAKIRLMRRTDTKFVAQLAQLPALLEALEADYFAQRIDGQAIATYRTTYFDTDDFACFQCHQKGHRPRTKVRVRTYACSNDSFLEIKRKDNHGKTHKKRIRVDSLRSVVDQREGEDFLRERTGWDFDALHPALHNEFDRITLVNRAHTERLTLDFNLRFRPSGQSEFTPMSDVLIIELKREGRSPSQLLPVLRRMRIHPGGFSKYCIATAMTNTTVKINRFKKKFRGVIKSVES